MDINEVIELARRAGDEIMQVYALGASAADVREKGDHSPLTLADERSHARIVAGLVALTPDIPVVSEEDAAPVTSMAAVRWVVDPLDGTKEFIKRSDEFTVNIALVQGSVPVVGVVHAPALGRTWIGDRDGARLLEGSRMRSIRVASSPQLGALRIVASKDHAGPMVQNLLNRFPGCTTLSMGSSLKFCLVAEGQADLYLRDGPTMEWDTAAAHAVLRAAGGDVLTLDGPPLGYGKPDLKNPYFLAVGDSAVDWVTLLRESESSS